MTLETLTPYLGPRGARIVASVESAVAFVRSNQGADGGFVVHPEPRVLENALVLHSLARAGLIARVPNAERARSFLVDAAARFDEDDRHPIASIIERWLLDVALGNAPPIVDLSSPELSKPAFLRRGLLLGALALECGAPLVDKDAVGAKIRGALSARMVSDEPKKPWSAAEEASLFLLLCANKNPDLDARAAQTIRAALSDNGSVADNPLSTALAMWAAARSGDTRTAEAALDYLVREQKDGTWRFCTTEVWDTALIARTLLTGGLADDVTAKARAFLVAQQNADGGWGYGAKRDSDVDTTSLTLMVLGDEEVEASNRGVAHLLARRDEQGLWPTWIDKGDPVANDVAAHAVHALAHRGVAERELSSAKEWLAGRFDRNGWAADWYDNRYYAGYEIGVAVGRRHDHTKRLAATVLDEQNADGGFSPQNERPSTPAATGCALALLGEYVGVQHPAFVRGIDYLLDAQRGDGSWPGPTGMYGPRPFKSDYAMQTHALALFGLTTTLRKLGPGRERRHGARSNHRYLDVDAPARANGANGANGNIGRGALAHAVATGLIDVDTSAKLAVIGATDLTAMMFPSFSDDWLELATSWTLFTFVFDDELDAYDDERIARARTDEIFRGRGGALGLAVSDARRAIAVLSTARQSQAFSAAVADYFSAMTWQAQQRSAKVPTAMLVYRRMRPFTAAMWTFVRMLAIAEKLTLAQESQPLVRRALELAAWLPALDNDIVSAKKELAAGESSNAVLLHMHHDALSLDDALGVARAQFARDRARLDGITARLARDGLLTPAQAGALSALVDGCNRWQASTARYRDGAVAHTVGSLTSNHS